MQNNLQGMYQNIMGALNPQRQGMYPGQTGMANYVMQQAPTMAPTQLAKPQMPPYDQYLRDNQAQDTPINRLAYQKGLRPNQANQLAKM